MPCSERHTLYLYFDYSTRLQWCLSIHKRSRLFHRCNWICRCAHGSNILNIWISKRPVFLVFTAFISVEYHFVWTDDCSFLTADESESGQWFLQQRGSHAESWCQARACESGAQGHDRWELWVSVNHKWVQFSYSSSSTEGNSVTNTIISYDG